MLTDPLRSHKFNFHLDGEPVPVISVNGLVIRCPEEFQTENSLFITKAITQRPYFTSWLDVADRRTLTIDVFPDEGTEPALRYIIPNVKPRHLLYSDLDAGANQVLVEQLYVTYRELTVTVL